MDIIKSLRRICEKSLSCRQALFIAEAHLRGPSITFSSVRESQKISYSNLSRMAADLENKGLVNVEKNPDDPRKRSAKLTENGKDLADYLFKGKNP